MNRKKLMLTMAGLMSLSVGLTACGGSSDSGSTQGNNGNSQDTLDQSTSKIEYVKATSPDKNPEVAKNRKDLVVVGLLEPDGVLNPAYAESAYDQEICSAIFQPLLNNKEDGSLTPIMAAEMPKVSEDGKVITFKLKDGLIWSDGQPITTDDIEFTFMVKSDATYTGPSDMNNLGIKGWKDYKEGKTKDIAGIKKIDKQTIEFTLDKPTAIAQTDLGANVMPKHYYEKSYTQGNAKNLEELHRKPEVASGPYKFVSYKEGQEVVLEANDKFYGNKPKIKNLIFKTVTDKTVLAQLESGEVDIASDVSLKPESMEQMQDMGFIDVNYYPNNGYGYIGFNMLGNSKFKDRKVRQALTYATNRQQLVENVYGKYAKITNAPQSEVSWSFPKDAKFEEYKYDLDKAGQLLDEAGWKKNDSGKREKDGEVFKIKFLQTTGNDVVSALVPIMKESFEKIGIEFIPEQLDFTTLRTKSDKAKKDNDDKAYDMCFMAWGLVADPDASTIFKTGGSQNRHGYSNKKVDELLQKGVDEFDQEKRKPVYAELFKELNEDLPYEFVYQRMYCNAVNSRVKNFKDSNYVRFYDYLENLSLE